jgi:cytochrome o ubiquinol oxidase subunit 1
MPNNTGAGIILAGICTVFGFAMIWYIWWLAALSFVALIATAIGHTFNYDRSFNFPRDQVMEIERVRTDLLSGRA